MYNIMYNIIIFWFINIHTYFGMVFYIVLDEVDDAAADDDDVDNYNDVDDDDVDDDYNVDYDDDSEEDDDIDNTLLQITIEILKNSNITIYQI